VLDPPELATGHLELPEPVRHVYVATFFDDELGLSEHGSAFRVHALAGVVLKHEVAPLGGYLLEHHT
jgi:hypothetical protein